VLPANDLQRKTYVYSSAGDIDEITDELKGITYFYSYDSLHRLISETDSSGTPTDPGGATVFTNTHAGVPLHAVSSIEFNAGVYNIAYDANGNMTSGYDFTNP